MNDKDACKFVRQLLTDQGFNGGKEEKDVDGTVKVRIYYGKEDPANLNSTSVGVISIPRNKPDENLLKARVLEALNFSAREPHIKELNRKTNAN